MTMLAPMHIHSIRRDLDLIAMLGDEANRAAEHCAAEHAAVAAGRDYSVWPQGWEPLWPRPGAEDPASGEV